MVAARQLNRAGLEHLGSQGSHFKHFLESDLPEPPCIRDHPGIGCIDTVNIGIDQAFIRFQGCRNGDSGCIGTATSQSGDFIQFIDPLETRDNDNLPLVEVFTDFPVID